MDAKHTPGPWRQRVSQGYGPQTTIETTDGTTVATASWTNDYVWQANVRRIVQCVNSHDELLDALDAMVKAAARSGMFWTEIDAARAAIERAS